MTAPRFPIRRATTPAVSAPEIADWRLQGVCGEDPELFFPIGYGAQARMQRKAAKDICGRCPVRRQCLEWALDTGQGAGVWGGLDELERAGMVRPWTFTSLDWCMANQDLIARRRKKGVSWRVLADELRVRPDTVRRAVKAFEADRAQLDAAAQELAA